MPRVKYTARKDQSMETKETFAPAQPAVFPTTASTASGPRIARVAQSQPVIISDDEDYGPAATGELAPPPRSL